MGRSILVTAGITVALVVFELVALVEWGSTTIAQTAGASTQLASVLTPLIAATITGGIALAGIFVKGALDARDSDQTSLRNAYNLLTSAALRLQMVTESIGRSRSLKDSAQTDLSERLGDLAAERNQSIRALQAKLAGGPPTGAAQPETAVSIIQWLALDALREGRQFRHQAEVSLAYVGDPEKNRVVVSAYGELARSFTEWYADVMEYFRAEPPDARLWLDPGSSAEKRTKVDGIESRRQLFNNNFNELATRIQRSLKGLPPKAPRRTVTER
jgi:hypothetical protein